MVAGRPELLVVLGETVFEVDEVTRIVEVGRDVADAPSEIVPERSLRLRIGGHEEIELLAAVLAKRVVAVFRARKTDDRKVRRKRSAQVHRVNRREQHPLEQVAARTEEYDAARARDAIRGQALAQRIARGSISGCLRGRRGRLFRDS